MSDGRFGVGGQGGYLGPGYGPLYLDMLVDVTIGTPISQYVLTYNSATQVWEPQPAGAGDTKVYVYENGVQVGTVARYVNFEGTAFDVTEDAGNDWFLIELAGGVAAHDLTGASHTEDATGGAGNVLRASGATAFAWAQLQHADLGGATPDLHHAQSHALSGGDHTGDLAYTQIDDIVDIAGTGANNLLSRADHVHTDADGSSKVTYTDLSSIPSTFAPTAHVLSGTDHTASGLTIGHAIMADSTTTFSWQAPSYYTSFTTDFAAESLANLTTRAHGNLSDAPTDAHHDEIHTLAVTGPHTGELPWADMVAGTQGSIIRRGASDWEEHALGTTNYVLKSGAADVDWGQVDYSELVGTQPDPVAHALATSGPHSGTLPLTDLEVGSQGSIIRRGAADWEELTKGTTNYALVAGATDISWTQYDYTWLANIPGTFAPSSHGSSAHTGAIFAGANDSLGAFYLDIDDIGVPADPAVGQRRIFVNTADGKLSVRTNASTTISLEEQGGADADAIHDNVADEINQITDKASPVGADVLIIEDSAGASWTKKKVSITNLPGGADADAIHDNVDNEIQVITPKGAPVGADVIVIEDSAASWAKKSVTISNLPAGSPSFGSPTGAIDIGDAADEGTSGDSTRADHQHQFSAPGASYPVQIDIGDSQVDGTGTAPARSDHGHAFPAPAGGYPQDVAASEVDGTATTAARSDHVHAHGSGYSADAHHVEFVAADFTTAFAAEDFNNLATTAHVLASADHTVSGLTAGDILSADTATTYSWKANPAATVPLALSDLASYTQGSIIRGGAVDWEAYALGTETYVLKSGATDVAWGTVDWSELTGSQPSPIAHGSSEHSGAIFAGANDDFGAFYLDIDDIGVPADPAVTVRRLFVDTATGKLSVRTNASTTVSLEEQGGGVTWGSPTGNIDIGDAAVEGTSGDATRADHQHQFSAPGAGYPLDTANTEADGSATTPARSDHVHALGAHLHTATAGEGGTLTWANALAVASAGDHDHSGNTAGNAVPEASITFSATGHDHDGSGSENVLYSNLDSIPSTFDPTAHVLDSATHTITGKTTGQYLRATAATTFAFQARTFTVSATIKSPATGYTTIWRAPFGCTCTKLEGRQKGGTNTVINARYNGTTDVATGDLSLLLENIWYSTSTINQTAWSATDWLEIEVQTLGAATEITFVLTFTEP